MTEAFRLGFMDKLAESLSDEELAQLADYYNKNRKDRLTFSGDIGRFILTGGGGLIPISAYDFNRTGGTQLLGGQFKSLTHKRHTKKEVDRHNIIRNTISAVLGGLAGTNAAATSPNPSFRESPGRIAAVGATGALTGLLYSYIMQKIGQRRARKMLQKLKDDGSVA